MSFFLRVIDHYCDLKEKAMHDGSTISDLETLVDSVLISADGWSAGGSDPETGGKPGHKVPLFSGNALMTQNQQLSADHHRGDCKAKPCDSDQLLSPVAEGQVQPDAPTSQPAPLCVCGEPATEKDGKDDVCADCYKAIREVEGMSWAEYYGTDVR